MQTPPKDYEYGGPLTSFKNKIAIINTFCWSLLIFGTTALILSIIFNLQIVAFIGLGLIFWGGILLYIQPEEHTKKVLLDAADSSSLENLVKAINELGYQGRATYLPPKYFKQPNTTKIYYTKNQEQTIPEPTVILKQENNFFLKKNDAILFNPPGAELANLFENRLKINFTNSNMDYIQRHFPRLFIHDLEIAENIEINIETKKIFSNTITDSGTIKIKITNSIFETKTINHPELAKIYNSIGSPMISAIAIVLTKVTGQSVTIKDLKKSEDGKTIEVIFDIEKLSISTKPQLEPLPITQKSEPKTSISVPKIFSLKKIPSFSLLIIGLISLIWILSLTISDVTIHDKEIIDILFEYRPLETISLGIGMKFIHYYILSFIFLIFGTTMYIKGTEETIKAIFSPLNLTRLFQLFLILVGTIILIWITELTLYQVLLWDKSLTVVLFDESGEIIASPFGLSVIYYYIVGLIILFSAFIAPKILSKNQTRTE